jgi:hypothetical protein
LSNALYNLAGCSSSTRGVFGGGYDSGSTRYAVIEYITIASTGNATNFGNLLNTTALLAACSSSTRGVFAGGTTDVTYSNVIQYITIASTGSAIDFGDLLTGVRYFSGCSNANGGL